MNPAAQEGKILPILIGSGVSRAAGLPGVEQLSKRVEKRLAAKDGHLFGALKGLCEEDRQGPSSNYEDWLYIAIQLRDHLLREYENPGLIPLIEKILVHAGASHDTLREACESIIVSILTTVCVELRSENDQASQAYDDLAEALSEMQGILFRFFTLNHDLLLEQYFSDSGSRVACYDGFEGKRFSLDTARYREASVSLLKLHGSIDWWRAAGLREEWRLYEFIGVNRREVESFKSVEDAPLILGGTFNKIIQYSSPVFLQLLAEFHHTLQQADRLLVCGYGFGDKGINSLIVNWALGNKEERRLYVVDPKPLDRARGAIDGIRRQIPEPKKNYIGKDITWAEILKWALTDKSFQ